jgi:hypothetical protein
MVCGNEYLKKSLPLASANGRMVQIKMALAKTAFYLRLKPDFGFQIKPLAEANGNDKNIYFFYASKQKKAPVFCETGAGNV